MSSLLATRALLAVGQDWHVEIAVARTFTEYFPMSHATQIAISLTYTDNCVCVTTTPVFAGGTPGPGIVNGEPCDNLAAIEFHQ